MNLATKNQNWLVLLTDVVENMLNVNGRVERTPNVVINQLWAVIFGLWCDSNLSSMSLRCLEQYLSELTSLAVMRWFPRCCQCESQKSKTRCVLWDITRECEQSLDRYEEYLGFMENVILKQEIWKTLMFYALRFPTSIRGKLYWCIAAASRPLAFRNANWSVPLIGHMQVIKI